MQEKQFRSFLSSSPCCGSGQDSRTVSGMVLGTRIFGEGFQSFPPSLTWAACFSQMFVTSRTFPVPGLSGFVVVVYSWKGVGFCQVPFRDN